MEKFVKREKLIAKVPFQNILFVLRADFLRHTKGGTQTVFGELTESYPSTGSNDEAG